VSVTKAWAERFRDTVVVLANAPATMRQLRDGPAPTWRPR
jgi:hypothetical protein